MNVESRRNAVGEFSLTFRRPGQFTILLAALLCFLLFPPFFINYESTGVVASIFLSALLFSVLYVFPRRREFLFACMIAIPALAGRWLVGFHHQRWLMLLVLASWIGRFSSAQLERVRATCLYAATKLMARENRSRSVYFMRLAF